MTLIQMRKIVISMWVINFIMESHYFWVTKFNELNRPLVLNTIWMFISAFFIVSGLVIILPKNK